MIRKAQSNLLHMSTTLYIYLSVLLNQLIILV
jgi:hypothetical protein